MKIAINGFGRIGRTFFRTAHEKGLEIVAINDLTDVKTLAHLLKYDSTYGKFDGKVEVIDGKIQIDDKMIETLSEKDPNKLPWGDLGIDLVIESTGVFTDYESASAHIKAGAKKVIITAPAKGEGGEGEKIKTIVLGVNEKDYENSDQIISMASCTTNCLAPVAKVLDEALGIEKSFMSTIHSFTMDQVLQDSPHKDLRRARAALQSIIPTTTGATQAVAETLPQLKDKMNGLSFRVPTSTVSVIDFVALVGKETSKEKINELFKKASRDPSYQNSLAVTEEKLVSADFRSNPAGAIVDLPLTMVVEGNLIKVVAWYDNELGYSYRLAEFCKFIENSL
jgi:glyceraldehyde 3-phosphate dehydrogenase